MRHETLHTVPLDEKNGEPMQHVTMEVLFKLEVMEASGSGSPVAAQAQCEEVVRRDLQRPFDLGSGGLLLRGVLVRLSPGNQVLVVNQHHIASDGLSLRVFWRDLEALYRGEKPAGSDVGVQYRDFAVW